MTETEFLDTILQNPVNAAILERLPLLGAPQAHLVAGALFGSVWNAMSGRPPTENIRDYDLFYYDPDTSYQAEDAVIRRAAHLFADLGAVVEVRNQARVHLWFERRFGQPRPPISTVRQGIEQFLVRCTCLGVSQGGELYAPGGLDELAAGILRPNPHNADDGRLYRAKVASYRERWPWLRADIQG
ncbi:nucleotidyltransferase family protein [Deinococcus sp.]|uniref:nucleotidyltransferase family protein n=1 Tax=Deinococcus sp. TaxID=47478 RepID=UPI003CC5380E